MDDRGDLVLAQPRVPEHEQTFIGGRLSENPARRVKKARCARPEEVQALPPAAIEAMRSVPERGTQLSSQFSRTPDAWDHSEARKREPRTMPDRAFSRRRFCAAAWVPGRFLRSGGMSRGSRASARAVRARRTSRAGLLAAASETR